MRMIVKIKKTTAQLNNEGITYNEPGVTYNDARYAYGGVYGQTDSVVQVATVKPINPTIQFVGNQYTAGTLSNTNQGIPMGPGFFLFITY